MDDIINVLDYSNYIVPNIDVEKRNISGKKVFNIVLILAATAISAIIINELNKKSKKNEEKKISNL